MSATLEIQREWLGWHTDPYEVVLDGEVIGTVARSSAVQFSIEAGCHALRLRSGRRSSAARTFDVADGDSVEFTCYGVGALPFYLASLLRPGLAIALTRA